MKRGTESIVRIGKSVTPASFSGINVLSTVILGKKESVTKDFNGLFITDAVMLGKKISHAAIVTATVHGTSPLSLPSAVADSLAYVKAFGGTELVPEEYIDSVVANGKCEQRNLPAGYTELEYITFNATQIIDTGFTPDNNSRIESKCYRTGSDCWFYGASPSNPRVTLYHSSTGTCRWGNQSRSNVGFVADTEYTIVQDKNGLNINGVDSPWTSGTAGDFTCDRSLTIGNCNGGTGTRYFAGNFYYMKIYNNNVLVRDFVPCKNASNVVGLYDRVNGVFYTDTGLVAGQDAVPTPDTPMDIVSNNGVLKAFKTLNISTYDTSARGAGIDITFDGVTDRRRWDTLNDGGTGTKHYENDFVSIYMSQNGNNYFVKALVNGVVYNGSVYNMGEQIDTWGFTTAKNIDIYCPSINTDGTVETIEDTIGNTATAEMLLKVGDYQDVQSIIDGAVTRNVGVKVLDGTENWSVNSTSNAPFRITISDMEYSKTIGLDNIFGICSHFQAVANTASWVNYNNMVSVIENSRNVCFRYLSGISNINTFKQFLADQYNAGTPVIVIYPLATPTTESVTGQTLQVTDGDNVLEITQASLSGLELEAQYQASVSLTIQEVQDANLDPNVEVTIN